MSTKTIIVVFTIFIILAVAYFYASPYLAIRNLKQGIQNGDHELLSEYIDFPMLRQNIKEQLNASMMQQATESVKSNPFGLLGAAIAPKLIENLVDSYVTPSGLKKILAGEKVTSQITNPTPPSGMNDVIKIFENAMYGFDSLGKFSIRVKNKENEETRFVLTRSGLDWRLTNIILPTKSIDPDPKGEKAKETEPIQSSPVKVAFIVGIYRDFDKAWMSTADPKEIDVTLTSSAGTVTKHPDFRNGTNNVVFENIPCGETVSIKVRNTGEGTYTSNSKHYTRKIDCGKPIVNLGKLEYGKW